jgi:hypothetical protein
MFTPGTFPGCQFLFFDRVDIETSHAKFKTFFDFLFQSYFIKQVHQINKVATQNFLFGRYTVLSDLIYKTFESCINSSAWIAIAETIFESYKNRPHMIRLIAAFGTVQYNDPEYWHLRVKGIQLKVVRKLSSLDILRNFSDKSTSTTALNRLASYPEIGQDQVRIFKDVIETKVFEFESKLHFHHPIEEDTFELESLARLSDEQIHIENRLILFWIKQIFQSSYGYQHLVELTKLNPLNRGDWAKFHSSCPVLTCLLRTLYHVRNEWKVRAVRLPESFEESQLEGIDTGTARTESKSSSALFFCGICFKVFSAVVQHDSHMKQHGSCTFRPNANFGKLSSKSKACSIINRGLTAASTVAFTCAPVCADNLTKKYQPRQRSPTLRCDLQPLNYISLVGTVLCIGAHTYTMCCQPGCGSIMNGVDQSRTNKRGFMCRMCALKIKKNTVEDNKYVKNLRDSKKEITWQAYPKMHFFKTIFRDAHPTCPTFQFIHSNPVEQLNSYFRQFFVTATPQCILCYPPKLDEDTKSLDIDSKTLAKRFNTPTCGDVAVKVSGDSKSMTDGLHEFRLVAPGCVICHRHNVKLNTSHFRAIQVKRNQSIYSDLFASYTYARFLIKHSSE